MITKITYWYKKHYLTLLYVLLVALFIDVVIDPGNKIFHLKYILFGLIFIFWISGRPLKKLALPKPLIFYIVFISFFMPLYALSIGLLNNFLKNTDLTAIVYFNSFFFFLLIIPVYEKRYDLTKTFNHSTILIVIITIGSYCFLALKLSMFGRLVQFLVIDNDVAAFGIREYGGIKILMMYFRTSPLLVFPLTYLIHNLFILKDNKRFLLKSIILISIIVTLFLSGTRANLMSLIGIVLFYILYVIYKKSKLWFVLISIIIASLGIYGFSNIASILFDKNELSNSIKYGHFMSYIEHFSENTIELFIGQGLGRSFFSTGFNKLTNVTELTYLEIIRVWGLPTSMIFIFILLIPIIKEIKSKKIRPIFIAYLSYLFIAATNPFLLGSTGMLVLVYVFSNVYGKGDFIS